MKEEPVPVAETKPPPEAGDFSGAAEIGLLKWIGQLAQNRS
jgi:hypothetical protein